MNDDPHVETYEAFFGEGTEAEQLRIKEIAEKIGIADNDALWLIVYVMNYFGRFYWDLPRSIKESADASIESVKARCAALADAEMERAKTDLGNAVLEHADELAKNRGAYSVFLPLAWVCAGVFSLCLLCFVAGAAVAGKGWGRSPFDSLLGAPAGWILPVALLPLSGYSFCAALQHFRMTKKRVNLLKMGASAGLVFLAVLCFLRVL